MGLDRAPNEFQTFYFFHVWLDTPSGDDGDDDDVDSGGGKNDDGVGGDDKSTPLKLPADRAIDSHHKW